MKFRGILSLVLLVSALVLFTGCTGQQPAVLPTPVPATPGVISTTAVPTIAEKPATAVPTVATSSSPRQLIADKAWKIRSWRSEPELDMNNTSVQSVLADYTSRANDTFTWYENGTLVYRYANGTPSTTGTWSLAKNNTLLVENFTETDGFYSETENEILTISNTVFVIRYPTTVAGKEYFIIETQGL